MSTNGVVLLVLTVVTWVMLSAVLSSVIGVDGTGDRDIFLGLRWILAGVLICGLWAWLGGPLFVARGQGTLPAWARVAAVILVPASAASAFGGLYLSSQLAVRWPMTVAMSVPALIAGYVILLYLPSLRRVAGPAVLGGAVLGGAVWGAVLILSIVLWPAVSRHVHENDARRTVRDKEYAAATAQRNSETRSANLAKVKAMSPDQPLSDWYSLLEPENGVRSEALEALKTVERRQSDVEYLLTVGIQAPMILVPDLDLKYTLELCQSAQAFLRKTAQGIRITDRSPHPYQSNKYLEASLRSIPWFSAHGCNCGEGIAEIEDRVRAYVDTPDRRQMLILLAGLKEGH
jgi:hypothetical protein